MPEWRRFYGGRRLEMSTDSVVCVGGWGHVGVPGIATGVVHVGLVGLIWWSVGC